ncbi:MAG: hypothetical protein K0R00_2195 [Herbinix sp.]|jgi:hypothetical protein|nr:hypothetical protein [Herbinix sp.]
MKKNKILISIIILSILLNIALISLLLYEKNNPAELRKAWAQATDNANFLYQQYDETKDPRAYDYALGDVGTIVNLIDFINYGGNGKLSDYQKIEFSAFYVKLQENKEFINEHMTEVIEIFKSLQLEEEDAFIKMMYLNKIIYP